MTAKWRDLRASKLSAERQRHVDRAVLREMEELDLRELRELLSVTQVELARRTAMRQPEISRLERRADLHLSTLRRVVEALGGELELTVRFGSKRVRLLAGR